MLFKGRLEFEIRKDLRDSIHEVDILWLEAEMQNAKAAEKEIEELILTEISMMELMMN